MSWTHKFVEQDKSCHERSLFDCGEAELNDFFKTRAARHQQAGISKTMVLPEAVPLANGKYKICAFYSIAPSSINRKALPAALAKKLPHYPVPVFLIAQLAVDLQHQHQGLGKVALVKALQYLLEVNAYIKAYAVIVDCLNANAERFYLQYGFERLLIQGEKVRLFMPMKTVERLFC